MTRERWRQVKEIAADIIDQMPADWDAFIARSSEGDAEIRHEVMKIVLAAHYSPDEFLVTPPWRLSGFSRMTVAPTRTLAEGEILAGRYEIAGYLGHGGMGEVYEARDLELQEQIALKTIRPEIAQSDWIIERFKQEVKHTRRITHPNVCRVHDLFCHK